MGKVTIALALGAGYVLGARAGRERFEELKQATQKVAQRPEVQQAGARLKNVTGERLKTGSGRMTQRSAVLAERLRRRRDRGGVAGGDLASTSPAQGPGRAGQTPAEPAVSQDPLGLPPDGNGEELTADPLR